jgi:hypothetical protein
MGFQGRDRYRQGMRQSRSAVGPRKTPSHEYK